jgi:hypothetical protein
MRDVVWPTVGWSDDARKEAENLMRYVCPLAKAVHEAAGILEHSKELRKAVGMAILCDDDLIETEEMQ